MTQADKRASAAERRFCWHTASSAVVCAVVDDHVRTALRDPVRRSSPRRNVLVCCAMSTCVYA